MEARSISKPEKYLNYSISSILLQTTVLWLAAYILSTTDLGVNGTTRLERKMIYGVAGIPP